MFYDEAEINISSGKGGDGAVSFRREKFIPKGGPDGGDGGQGGDVWVQASRQISDLSRFISTHHWRAVDGQAGGGRKMTGRDGDSLTLVVPVGTRIWRWRSGVWRRVADLTAENATGRLLRGGRGGRGNVHFATATRQTPRQAEPGQRAQTGQFRFELVLLADVGLVGLPNVGKSSLLAAISRAKPAVAAYPFTTLSPVLGAVRVAARDIVVADIPGLVAGAAKGKGLGHRFLRHIGRTAALLILIDAGAADPATDYATVMSELGAYDPVLLTKPRLVAISRDDQSPSIAAGAITSLKRRLTEPATLFSGRSFSTHTGHNLERLLVEMTSLLPDQTPPNPSSSR